MITEKEYLEALNKVKEHELSPRNKERILLSDFLKSISKHELPRYWRLLNVLNSRGNGDRIKNIKYLDELTKEEFLKLPGAGIGRWKHFHEMQQKEILISYRNTIKIAEQENINKQLVSFPNAKELLRQFKELVAENTNTNKELKQLEKQHKKLVEALKNKLRSDIIIREYIE